MRDINIKEMALFEHQFWLQVLGDHSRFILNGLSPKEDERIKQADMFIKLFDNLLNKSRTDLSDDSVKTFNNDIYTAVKKFRDFKLDIISNQINGKISISLPCDLISHMVNELDEYMLILNALTKESFANAKPIHLHLLWLPDSAGHASFISNNLDGSQRKLIKEMRRYCEDFDRLYMTAMDYKGYMRSGIDEFPAFQKFNLDVDEMVKTFKYNLKDLVKCVADKTVISVLPPLVYDHMFREECYYLLKLSLVSNIEKPSCNPIKPRIES